MQEFLARFEGVKGSGVSYTARCPAHNDRHNSLSIGLGNNGGIVVHCHAGCSPDAVVLASGATLRDLMPPDAVDGNAPARPQPKQKQAAPLREPWRVGDVYYNKAGGREETITHIYGYQRADGEVALKVARTTHKSFPVCSIGNDGQWYYGRGAHGDLLYHLPDVLAAAAAGEQVLVVEGEKDADNLRTLGYCATTSLGGGGKNKWPGAGTTALAGARVYVLPDNDSPGRAHATAVAKALMDAGVYVRVIDLASACLLLPPKGDVTDYLRIQGGKSSAVMALNRLLDEADAGAPPTLNSAAELSDAERMFAGVSGYSVIDGCLAKGTQDGHRALCTFAAAPVEQLLYDDGADTDLRLRIAGWDKGGRALPEVVLGSEEYGRMNWPLKYWGAAGNIMPGTATKGYAMYAMTAAAALRAPMRTVYTHTGWRQMGGEWAYLHSGGAIGADDVHVEMGGSLASYGLAYGDDLDLNISCAASLGLHAIAPARLAVPLLACCYLAPLVEFLGQRGISPSFVLYLYGESGTMKSTLASLALCHFGQFGRARVPSSFADTLNTMRQKAHALKDCVLLVDDFHPVSSAVEKRRMNDAAQGLSRAYGDRADRGRLGSDLRLREAQPPRGLAIVTGEDLPDIGASGLARYLIVTMHKNDLKRGEELTGMQKYARDGLLRRAMAGYIDWLQPQADALPDRLESLFEVLRADLIELAPNAHSRSPEAVAHLMVGYTMMLEYMVDTGVMGDIEAEQYRQDAMIELCSASERQEADARRESPTAMYLRAVSELMASGDVQVVGRGHEPDAGVRGPVIGWMDANCYYLLPDVSYSAVFKMYSAQGILYPVSRTTLGRRLQEQGLIQPGTGGTATRAIRVGSRLVRVFIVSRSVIDGDLSGPPPEQMTLEPKASRDDGQGGV